MQRTDLSEYCEEEDGDHFVFVVVMGGWADGAIRPYSNCGY